MDCSRSPPGLDTCWMTAIRPEPLRTLDLSTECQICGRFWQAERRGAWLQLLVYNGITLTNLSIIYISWRVVLLSWEFYLWVIFCSISVLFSPSREGSQRTGLYPSCKLGCQFIRKGMSLRLDIGRVCALQRGVLSMEDNFCIMVSKFLANHIQGQGRREKGLGRYFPGWRICIRER